MMSEFMEWTNNGSQQIFIFYNLEIGTAQPAYYLQPQVLRD